MNKSYDEIVDSILDYLETLPTGKEICTYEAFVKVFGSDCIKKDSCTINGITINQLDLMQIDLEIRKNAHRRNLILDSSKYEGMAIGLPHSIGYVIRRKSAKRVRRNSKVINVGEIHDKQWWIDNIAPILEGSKFEVKLNPCERENCVIVVLKEAYREYEKKKDHYLAVKPYVKGGYAAWMKMDVYTNASQFYDCPEPTKIHSNMPHFINLSDTDFIFNVVKNLIK